jgi:cytochrome P450
MDFFRVGYAAREIVFDAFRDYCSNIPADAAGVVHVREHIFRTASVSDDEIPKQHAAICAGIFPNLAVTLFWAIFDLFSQPEVLTEVRAEIKANAVRTSQKNGTEKGQVFVLDVTALKTRCPLLLSVFQETQRTRSILIVTRKVMEDTLLDGRYLLKKNNYVQIPAQAVHTSQANWGSSAHAFDPYRFMNKGKADSGGSNSVASKFLPWGIAPHVCPAKDFALTEILIVLALLVLRVNLQPINGGEWNRSLPTATQKLPTLANPAKDLQLRVNGREEALGRWRLEMGESKARI